MSRLLLRSFPTSITTQHREYQASILSTCRFPFSRYQTLLSHGKSDEYIIFFLRNRGSEKERVAEEMPISEVRKCSRLLTPVNSLIDQLHHCVVGTYMLVDHKGHDRERGHCVIIIYTWLEMGQVKTF